MFLSIFTAIFRGLVSNTLCSYYVGFRWCTFVVCLCIMRPYVITIGLYVCLELLSGSDLLRESDQISPGQQVQTHIQTDGNDIRPHTVQTHNERTSTESSLVTAQNTAHDPPEDGRKYGPKHVGATLLKCF